MTSVELGSSKEDSCLREVVFDETPYVYLSWEQMGKYNFDLAKQIIESNLSFDRIIALARGGWTWARDLSDALKISTLSSVRIKSYTGVNEAGVTKIIQPLTEPIGGETVLLFDEIIDSGETIKKAKDYLRAMDAKDVKIASLCYKSHSIIKPDFFAFSTSAWAIFPHETREFIEIVNAKWKGFGFTQSDIITRLIQIGIPRNQIEFYLSLQK